MSIATLTVYQGSGVVLTANFTLVSTGALTDPTTISLEVKSPSGSVTTYTFAGAQITKTSTGIYTKTLTSTILNAAGVWYYSWIGTGTAEGVDSGTIVVKARPSA